jgi:superfamily II DNA or RNA helicase
VTGTFPKIPEKGYENLVIQSYIGPLIYEFTANRLINEEKRATPIHILFQFLDWATQKEKRDMWLMRKNKNQEDIQAGSKILKEEEKFINANYTRLKYIGDLAIKIKTNLLVLFGDIKHGGGKRVYEYIKENCEKYVYYVDGTTKPENREWIKQQMEDDAGQHTVIVASIGTFGEGIDIKNVGTIMIISSSKSERIVRQICGRGLRMSPYKDKTVIIDIVDDLRYSENGKHLNNYMYKHYLSRKKIYDEQKFPCYQQKISFDQHTTNTLI